MRFIVGIPMKKERNVILDSFEVRNVDKKKAEPETAKPSEEDVLKEMKRLAQNGITEFTSTLLRDKLNLDKESGRDQIRRVMRKLEKAGKVVISRKQQGKRKQYVYKLKEEK